MSEAATMTLIESRHLGAGAMALCLGALVLCSLRGPGSVPSIRQWLKTHHSRSSCPLLVFLGTAFTHTQGKQS